MERCEEWDGKSTFLQLFTLVCSVHAQHPVTALGLGQAPVCKAQRYIRQLPFLVPAEPTVDLTHIWPASKRVMDLVQPQADGIFHTCMGEPLFLTAVLLSRCCQSQAELPEPVVAVGRQISKWFPLVFSHLEITLRYKGWDAY